MTLDLVFLWNADPNFNSVIWFYGDDPHILAETLGLLGALALAYCIWMALCVRHWVSGAGTAGFLIALLGVNFRFWGDLLLTLPDPNGWSGVYRIVSAEQAYEPELFRILVGTARHGARGVCDRPVPRRRLRRR